MITLPEEGGKKLLLDVAPDFRQMALNYNISYIDGLIITHAHYDHIGGLDELRVFFLKNKKPIPCLLSESSFQELKNRYGYLFKTKNKTSLSVELDFKMLKGQFGKVSFVDTQISYFSYFQKSTEVTGFKIGNLAYVTDIKEYDEELFKALEGVDILILSALREGLSPVHFNFSTAIEFAQKTKAKQVYFTHIAHETDHKQASRLMPPQMQIAYDGLEIEFEYAKTAH